MAKTMENERQTTNKRSMDTHPKRENDCAIMDRFRDRIEEQKEHQETMENTQYGTPMPAACI
jgi:hypothetical protein